MRRTARHLSPPNRRGAVLVVVLVAMTLLVGLVFFVYNLGDQASRRVTMQNASDAAAVSGSGWMARSMNVVAMNNVGQAKMISLALVLDAVPLSAELALKELQLDPQRDDSLSKGLERQLGRGVPDSRQEKGYARSASYAKVVADAILLMPGGEPVFGPLWPGDEDSENPAMDYNSVQARIRAVGTILNNPQLEGDWNESAAENEYAGQSYETLDPRALATWKTGVASGQDEYRLYAWWSSDRDGTHRWRSSRYSIARAGGSDTVTMDQNRNCGTWMYLGTYRFDASGGASAVTVTLAGPPDDANRDQELTNFLRNGLDILKTEMAPADGDEPSQYDELEALDEALNSADELVKEDGAYDVAETTHWSGPTGRGKLWAAALAMKELSTATAESAGVLAQSNAGRFGRANGATSALLTPILPQMPFRRGDFDSFAPVLTGFFRVRTVEPVAATLEMPIYEEVDRINNLDASLDDVEQMLNEIRQNLDDITAVTAALAGEVDWEQISATLGRIRQRVEDIEARRNNIGNRLDVMGRLATMAGQVGRINEKLAQIQEEVNGGRNLQRLLTWLGELENLHQHMEQSTGLDELVFREGDLELAEKENRLANLHNTCPGGGIPDYKRSPLYRLGPYATLHRWRREWYEYTSVTGPGWGGDPEIGASSERQRGPLLGYTTYGPYRWTLDQLTQNFGLLGVHTGSLDTTRFSYYVHLAANIKLGYVYGVARPQNIRYVTRWITDYQQARLFAGDPQNRSKILRTRYYRPVIMSSVKWDHPNWLKDRGTYWCGHGRPYPFDDPLAALWVWEPRGWYDVAARRGGAEKLNDYIWRWNRQYSATHERRVNLFERRSAADGSEIPWNLYVSSWYVFGGIQVAEEVTVANPCNWPADEANLPLPLLMNTADPPAGPGDYTDDYDHGARRNYFTFLGIACKHSPARVWPQRFVSGNPAGSATAVAQAELFNNLSWDLWTRNWASQLVPVSRWELWQERLTEGLDDVPQAGQLDEDEVQAIVDYINALPPELMDTFVSH